MKKIIALSLAMVMVLIVAACDVETGRRDLDGEALEALIETFEMPEVVEEDFELPDSYEDASIQWASSDESRIALDGTVTRPFYEDGDETVTLTATFTLGSAVRQKDFDVLVVALEPGLYVSHVELLFENLATEYIVEDGVMDVFYIRDEVIPYVDVQSFMSVIEGAIVYEEIDFIYEDMTLTVEFIYEYTEEDLEEDDDPALIGETYEYRLIADFEANTITVNMFSFFSAIAEATQTDFGQELFVIDSEYHDGEEVTINLDDYNMDIYLEDELHLMPLHLANLFFTGSMFDVYYNGDMVYGVDTYQLMGDQDVLDQINASSLNGEAMPLHLAENSLDFLALTFDHFFGLNLAYDEEEPTGYERFDRTDEILRGARRHYTAVMRTAYDFDDLHTSHTLNGYYIERDDFDDQLWLDWFGPRMRAFYDALMFDTGFSAHCNTNYDVRYYENETIAIVSITGFDVDTPDEFKADLEAIEAKGTVETVIVDLSCNTGGNVGATFRTIGYMTDEPIEYYSVNAFDGSKSEVYYGTENEAFDFEWVVLTSPVTYSAGSMMTSIIKDMGIAPIIGMQSTGGASSITTNILPSGTILMMSSAGVMANSDFESTEFGIPVDLELTLAQIRSGDQVVSNLLAWLDTQENGDDE